ncbi:MAG: hypothetical protein NTV97_17505 [Alphaproteobacteria bacterium]|nr:hypothetical protein [Alphaproteobacteria bacterium]
METPTRPGGIRSAMASAVSSRKRSTDARSLLRDRKNVGRRQAMDAAPHRALDVDADAGGEKIADPCVVELTPDLRPRRQPRQRIAHQDRGTGRGMKQRAHAELVAGGDQPCALDIPQRKAEVARDMIEELLPPASVGLQAARGVRRSGIAPPVETQAPHDPEPLLQALDAAHLPVGGRAIARPQERNLAGLAQNLDVEAGSLEAAAIDGRAIDIEERGEQGQAGGAVARQATSRV